MEISKKQWRSTGGFYHNMQIEDLYRKTQFQKIRMLMKKYLLNQKRCFESDSKVRGGNLTKVLDFSAFEKFDFTYLQGKYFHNS